MARVDYSVLNMMSFSVLSIRGGGGSTAVNGNGDSWSCFSLTISLTMYRLGVVVLTSYPFPRLMGGVTRCKPLSSQLTWTSFQNLVEHGKARNKKGGL